MPEDLANLMKTSSNVAFATPQSKTVISCFTLLMASNTPLKEISEVGSSYLHTNVKVSSLGI